MNIAATPTENPVSKPAAGFPADYFQNREMGLLAFNRRVLWQAKNPKTPLLERLRFLCIVSSNLDEFFEIRVAGIKEQLKLGSVALTTDGKTARESPVWSPTKRTLWSRSSTHCSMRRSYRCSPARAFASSNAPTGMPRSANGSVASSSAK